MKILGGVLLLALVAPFFLKGRDGRSLMTFDYFSAPELSMPELSGAESVVRTLKKSLPEMASAETTQPIKACRRRDKNGVLRYSDQPAIDPRSVEVVLVPRGEKAN